MKRLNAFSLVAGLLLCTLPLAAAWSADEQTPRLTTLPPNPAIYPQDSQQDPQQQPEVKIFTGRISKSGQKFILEDPAMNTSYQLDDQKQAQQHEGKNVRVKGTLDAQNNLIHVHAIDDAG
jgi:hypothetical protein